MNETPRQPLVSIIIPTYQHGGEIGQCLDSVFGLAYGNIEVIVVNDGSTDDTLAVLQPFTERLTLINQGPRQPGDDARRGNIARNRGFDASHGEFVIFCDADVVMRPDTIGRLLAALTAHPEASYAYTSFRYGFKGFRCGPFDAKLLRRRNFIMTTSLIRRAHFPRFDESVKRLQDWDLWLTMLEHGHVGVWVPEYLLQVVPHRGGISAWLPRFAVRFPWRWFGLHPRRVERFLEAEAFMKKKHHLE